MSLQTVNETQQSEIPVESEENVQRTTPIIPIYSFILIACLIAVSLCEFAVDGKNSIIYGGEASVLLAGFVKPAFSAGEYWRMLTGILLHAGLIHLLFNCYALHVLGRLIEILSNRAHLVIVFLLAGIGGNILSLIFMPNGVSVGASGGILGFLGYLAVYGYKRRKLLPPSFLKNMLFNIAFIAIYGIMLYRVIDNFGHLDGLLTGALYGIFQVSGDVYKDPRAVGSKVEMIGLIALGVVIAASIFSCLILIKVI